MNNIRVEVFRSTRGFALIEAIVAIAICVFSIVVILTCYGMALQTKIVSKNILNQSLEVTGLYDEINSALVNDSEGSIRTIVDAVLVNYPAYSVESVDFNETRRHCRVTLIQQALDRPEKKWIFDFYRSKL
jgi:Tfp pilus assembly protein PilV